jgi:hypothetical protein
MTPKQALKQLQDLTESLVELSLSNEQNFPTTRGDPAIDFEISVSNSAGLTTALKNIPYADIYVELERARCYNFKMLDGGLLSLRYRFSKGEVKEHNLAYYPAPDFYQFQNEPEIYLEDDVYADVVARNIVAVPVRFDFSSDQTKYVDIHHPYSHLTLGQYTNCRIPVCSPVGPLDFGGFILRSFYNTAFRKYSEKLPASNVKFGKTISANEQKVLHFVCG